MAKKKPSYRGSIRIDGSLIQARFANKKDRDEWYTKMRAQRMRARAGLEVEFEPIEIERIAADFLMSRQNLETWKHDKFRLEHYFLPTFFGRMIHSITRKDWKEAMSELITVHGLSPKTYNNIRTMLSTLYDFAIQEEPKRAQFNPIKEIVPLPVMHAEMKFFHTEAECQKYLTHAQTQGPMFGMFAYIALNTGMREGEITSLAWECVDLERRTIHIKRTWSHSTRKIVDRTKGKRERVIGINQTLHDAFTRHRQWSPFKGQTELVVCNRKGGPLESKHLQEMHKRAMTQAELAYMVIHSLRHTFATQYLAKGGSIWTLKNMLGHQSIKTTERYSHALPLQVQESAGVFEVGVK